MVAQRIAVFRALNLGDMLCAVPALRTLRAGYPDADIALVGLSWAAAFQKRYASYVDRFFVFPGYPGLPEAKAGQDTIRGFFERMQAERFDLGLQMHGSGPVSNSVVYRFGARRAIGLGQVEQGEGIDVLPYPDNRHEVARNIYLIEHGLGVRAPSDRMEFPLREDDWQELAGYPELDECMSRPYVCLQAGARDPGKRWPTSCFAAVGDALAGLGYQVVLTGSGAERALAQEIADQMQHACVNAACDISIGGLAALLSRAQLLISNDTGVAHIASALGLPSVVIFFATDPARWGPPASGPHRVVVGSPLPGIHQVLEAATALLEQELSASSPLSKSAVAALPTSQASTSSTNDAV